MKKNLTRPFFSIITSTKNSEKYLSECLSSVGSQSFLDYEHIIVDGKSTDETLPIIKKYLAKNSRAKLYSFPPKGISDAMNKGVKKARGKYVYILHSDDNMYGSRILSGVATFLKKNSDIDWVYGQIKVIDDRGKRVGVFPKYKIFQSPHSWLLKLFNYIPHQAVFIKKNILDKEKFDEKLSSSMDLDLWLRIASSTKWVYMPILVTNYRIHSSAQSSSRDNLKENQRNHQLVKSKYLSVLEQFLSQFIYRVLNKVNKTTK